MRSNNPNIGCLYVKEDDFLILTWKGGSASIKKEVEPGISVMLGVNSKRFAGVRVCDLSTRVPESIARTLNDCGFSVPGEFTRYISNLEI